MNNDQKMPEPLVRVFESMRALLSKCVVPIYFTAGGNPGLEGTGTLFRIGEESFLVTAAHVIGKEKDKTQFYIADGADGALTVPLGGKVFVSNDLYDVAVWPLHPSVVEKLPNRRFLRLTDVDLSPEVTPGLFFIYGYPCERKERYDEATRSMRVRSFSHAASLYKSNAALRTYDPALHVLVSLDRNDLVTEDGSRPEVPGSLQGISGSSMWRVLREGQSPSAWALEQAKVVAVETRVHSGNPSIIQGTRWHAVMVLLAKQHPAIRPALELHLPGLLSGSSAARESRYLLTA